MSPLAPAWRQTLVAAVVLIASPVDARCDDASAESVVMQDESGRIVVLPPKPAASAGQASAPAQRRPASAPTPRAVPARGDVDECDSHASLVESWSAARQRVAAAEREVEGAEAIPLSGMGGYREAVINSAHAKLDKAEAQESEIDDRARTLGVPPRCFDDAGAAEPEDD